MSGKGGILCALEGSITLIAMLSCSVFLDKSAYNVSNNYIIYIFEAPVSLFVEHTRVLVFYCILDGYLSNLPNTFSFLSHSSWEVNYYICNFM